MPIALVIITLQILCGLHVVKTGRQLYWLFIIIIAPLIGCLIYFVAEMLPEIQRHRAPKPRDPNRSLREALERLDESDTVDNRRAVAEEYLRLNDGYSALDLYKSCLTGVHQDDPTLLYGLARAEFAVKNFAAATDALDRLRAANPDYQSPDAHLLYARALDEQARWDEARREYESLAGYYPGAEAKCRYAMMLKKSGDIGRARVLFAEVVKALDRAGRAYIRDQRDWYDLAKSNLR
jgi:hypothetical protein